MDFLKNKKIPWFWVIYATVIVLIVTGVIVGLTYLNSFLTSFENAQPIHPAQEAFDYYFASGNFELALEKAGFQVGEFETLADAAAVLRGMSEGKEITFYSVPTGEGEARYNIVLVDPNREERETETSSGTSTPQTGEEFPGGIVPLNQTGEGVNPEEDNLDGPAVQGIPSTKIASIRLIQETTPDRWGFCGYSLDSIEIFLNPKNSVTITLPSSSELLLNGKAVSKEYVVSSEEHPCNRFLANGIEGVTWETYEITGLFQAPGSIGGTDRNGVPHQFSTEEETGAYKAALNYSQDLKNTYSEFLMAGMKEYAKHIQNDVNFNAVRPYFDPNSVFFRHIYENLSQFVWDHNGYTFRDEYIDEFYQFDENTFSCHVSFDHVLHMHNREDYVDNLDMVIFVHRVGDKFMIYDRYNVF